MYTDCLENNRVIIVRVIRYIYRDFSFSGFTASSLTNPIWFVKTRLQLDNNKNGLRLSTYECVRRIYNQSVRWPASIRTDSFL